MERLKNNKKVPTFKESQFAKHYVANKGNGTQAVLETYNTTSQKVASVIAVENLAKPRVQEEIKDLLKEKGLDLSSITTIHKRNLEQDKQLGVSQTAVQDGYKLYGLLSNRDTQSNTNIAIIIGDRIK